MIVTRTPFRVSFAGGGSDLAAFHSLEPGVVLSTAINKYMYLTVKERFDDTFRVSYSRTELARSPEEIEHPIVRECLKKLGVRRGLEIVSIADLPAQSGMGSSSAFTVGLLHALHALQGQVVSADRLSVEACEIEIDRLKEPIGKQDQYIAAYGGLQQIQFQPEGDVFVDPVICTAATRRELNRRLLLFFTGGARDAREVLGRQVQNPERKAPYVRKLCEIARQLREILTLGRDLNDFGRLLHTAWEVKKLLERSISNCSIDRYYEQALNAGALGGKLLGAGGGGFLLIFAEPHHHDPIREALADIDEVPFRLEPQGSKIIYVGTDRW